MLASPHDNNDNDNNVLLFEKTPLGLTLCQKYLASNDGALLAPAHGSSRRSRAEMLEWRPRGQGRNKEEGDLAAVIGVSIDQRRRQTKEEGVNRTTAVRIPTFWNMTLAFRRSRHYQNRPRIQLNV
ncbi:hypothetical protein F66182_8977 [Fusarium sp. NRRL 66182]|nr:hypothetical protein F66182_8977 [Fusarium sp. NRRL 66182]